MSLITCREYAERNGLSPTSVRHKCMRGGFKTAKKIGRDWLIDEHEVNVDHRIRGGQYVGFRARKGDNRGKEESEREQTGL